MSATKEEIVSNFSSLEEVDEVSFDDLIEQLQESSGAPGKDDAIVSPETKLDARDWLLAELKMSDEMDYLKKEYLPYLMKRYIEPVKEKIAKNESSIEIVRKGLKSFLESAGESSISFPELATVSISAKAASFEYPEDDEELVDDLRKNDETKEFVKVSYSLDKAAIKDLYSKSGTVPSDKIKVKTGETTLKITRPRKKK